MNLKEENGQNVNIFNLFRIRPLKRFLHHNFKFTIAIFILHSNLFKVQKPSDFFTRKTFIQSLLLEKMPGKRRID